MRPTKIAKTLGVLAALVAGCSGGGKVTTSHEDEGSAPRGDAGARSKPVPRDAGTSPASPSAPSSSSSPSSTNVGSPKAPEPKAPAGVRADSVQGERLLGALSADERQRLCQDNAKQVARAISLHNQVQCTGDALALSKTTEECNTKRAACLGRSGALAEDSCATDADALAQDCAEVSVADVRACTDAWTKQLEQAAAKTDCGMLSASPDKPSLEDPEECQNIDARCLH